VGRIEYPNSMETVIENTVTTAEKSISAVSFLTHSPKPSSSREHLPSLSDFRAVSTYEKSIHDHRTGRTCALCGGALFDTIINFGENLSEGPLRLACEHADKADLCLVLGSSLTVSPSNDIPKAVGRKRGAELVICNLQSTPIDHLSDIRIFAKVDDLMSRVMTRLGLPIPSFILRRRLVIQTETTGDKRYHLVVKGVDVDGTPATFLQSVRLDYNRRTVRSEPFIINFRSNPEPETQLKVELEFMGHYGEPNLEVTYISQGDDDTETHFLLEYNPGERSWKTTRLENPAFENTACKTTSGKRMVVDLTGDN